ncbi:hypothetical protein ACFR97_00550 [Haloplanus litoreus]|uniref:Uncharacterized protein n=1 Tax=Haloplanus litoreus TaxID=767515 RepID=A0ABD5ZVA4_9EURY
MRGHTRRTFLRLCGAGATATVLGATGATRAAAADNEDSIVEQARYVSKYAVEGAWAFEELTPLFDPPSDEDLEQYFRDSYMPSVADLLPTLVGDAVDLAQTLQWYEEVGAGSGFYAVSEAGWSGPETNTFTGGQGEALSEARGELRTIADRFATVDERAQACISDPSTSNVERLVDAMGTLTDELDHPTWVERWSNVDTGEYGGLHPTAPQAATRLQDNAQVVLDVASNFADLVDDQREALRTEAYQPFPSAIVTFEGAVGDIRAEVPGFVFDRFAGDSYHIRTENEDGESLSVRWLETDATGAVASYELGEQDSADADVVLTETTLTDIVDAKDSMAAAVEKYQSGDVEVSGNGLLNGIEYSRYFGTLIDWIADVL